MGLGVGGRGGLDNLPPFGEPSQEGAEVGGVPGGDFAGEEGGLPTVEVVFRTGVDVLGDTGGEEGDRLGLLLTEEGAADHVIDDAGWGDSEVVEDTDAVEHGLDVKGEPLTDTVLVDVTLGLDLLEPEVFGIVSLDFGFVWADLLTGLWPDMEHAVPAAGEGDAEVAGGEEDFFAADVGPGGGERLLFGSPPSEVAGDDDLDQGEETGHVLDFGGGGVGRETELAVVGQRLGEGFGLGGGVLDGDVSGDVVEAVAESESEGGRAGGVAETVVEVGDVAALKEGVEKTLSGTGVGEVENVFFVELTHTDSGLGAKEDEEFFGSVDAGVGAGVTGVLGGVWFDTIGIVTTENTEAKMIVCFDSSYDAVDSDERVDGDDTS